MEYRGYYISRTDDCVPNEGGYYCQVYSDPDCSEQIDDFCIHPDELKENPDIEYWIKQNVDSLCHEPLNNGMTMQ